MVSEVPHLSNDTATLVLTGGGITLPRFSRGVSELTELIQSLTTDFGRGNVSAWMLDRLESPISHSGSRRAITTTRGVWDTIEGRDAVESVVEKYEEVGRRLQSGSSLSDFSPLVEQSANRIRDILGDGVQKIRLETAREDAEITAPGADSELVVQAKPPVSRIAFGSVRGRIESMSQRRAFRFMLYEYHTDVPITCYFDRSMEDEVRAGWGQIAIVHGLVRRDPDTGEVTTIRRVNHITPLVEYPTWNFRAAKGSTRSTSGETPEEDIRKIRDA